MHVLDRQPPLTSMCPGYEREKWREDQLVQDVFDRHLISFASSYSTHTSIDADSAAKAVRTAARAIYQTDKYKKRGEFGELFLHAILRDVFDSEPAVSKIFFKDGPNETVKGFDAVHVIDSGQEIELWLGEVKFYRDLQKAIYDVTSELALHLKTDYLRNEFVAVMHKIDTASPYADRLNRLLDENTSLDEIFDAVTIPILLTYESEAVATNTCLCETYTAALKAEAEDAWTRLSSKVSDTWKVRIRLILMPLSSKDSIVAKMDEKLKIWQMI